MKRFLNTSLLLCLIGILSCGSNEESPAPTPLFAATNVSVKDVGNSGGSADLQVRFGKPSTTDNIEEFRIIVVPESKLSSFDSLAAISSSHYFSLHPDETTIDLRMPMGLLDFDGGEIVEEVVYRLFTLSYGGQTLGGKFSTSSNPVSLRQVSVVYTIARINAGSGGMDLDADGNIYMADFGATLGGNPRGTEVFKITPGGVVSSFASGLNGASGNDFDAEGNLFQSSIAGGFVSKISPTGSVSQHASGFQGPVGVVVGDQGELFVCNCSNNTISRVSPDGIVSTFAESPLMNCPNGIDMDPSGNLYVASFNSNNLVKISPEGQLSVLATLPGNNNGHLLIHGSYIYVVSRGLHQIHRVTFGGQVSLFAGSGARGIVDGGLSEASFSLPNDLAISPDGKRMYVNDVDGRDPDVSIISPVAIRVIDIIE